MAGDLLRSSTVANGPRHTRQAWRSEGRCQAVRLVGALLTLEPSDGVGCSKVVRAVLTAYHDGVAPARPRLLVELVPESVRVHGVPRSAPNQRHCCDADGRRLRCTLRSVHSCGYYGDS
jgi:hypothetical protein